MRGRVQRIHLIGIGGVGMSGIAEILAATGYRVSGSDLREGAATRRLREQGITVTIGHTADAARDADVVVYSSAVARTNPEIGEAQHRQIPVIGRAEMLAELMRMKYGVAISGSHGKTTTTSLVAEVLGAGGLDPTTIVGGRVHNLGSNSRLGTGDILVAEADESDGSFLRLVPTVVVVTNIDREHLDHYGSFEAVWQAFVDFANRVPFYGANVVCIDDPQVGRMLGELERRTTTYGLSTQADISAEALRAEGLGMRFGVRAGGRGLGEVRVPMPGVHNAANALAAIAVGLEFDVPFARIREALEQFKGVERRFEVCGEVDGVLLVDDYAHHPSEIAATLAAARQGLERRVVVAFQPHRYSRTRDCFDDLAACFHDADCVLITDIYAAGEEKLAGVSAEVLAEAVRERGHRDVSYVHERAALVAAARDRCQPGDVLLFLGAGDIGRLAHDIADRGGWTD